MQQQQAVRLLIVFALEPVVSARGSGLSKHCKRRLFAASAKTAVTRRSISEALHWLIEKHSKHVGRVRPSKRWRTRAPSERGHIAVKQ
jgi:hypothetical protein